MDESFDRARQRDQRERDVIAHLALIAPSPELIKRVVLDVPEQSQPLDGATGRRDCGRAGPASGRRALNGRRASSPAA